jgi:RNA recognition motif-containing protein
MSVRLFVGNLAYDVTEAELKELFSAVGVPSDIRLPTDRETGKPRGFAFVEFSERAHAEEAIGRFNQQLFKGRPLAVSEARPRGEAPPPRSAPPFRSAPSRPPAWSSAPPPGDEAPRMEQPRRNFGPDAPPRGRRRPEARTPKGEKRPKTAVKERGGARRFISPELEDDLDGEDLTPLGQDDSTEQDEN